MTQQTKTGANADASVAMRENVALECGWGRLIFGQTFSTPQSLAKELEEERPERRDIALYVNEPQVVLANAPHGVFLDPSLTFRLDLADYQKARRAPKGFFVRRLTSSSDAEAINRIYASRGMVTAPPEYYWTERDAQAICHFVAEDTQNGEVIGTVMGVDHARAFNDPEKGSSLWCLAVDAQARQPGIGEALVRRLAEYFIVRGASFLDLTVMHDNEQAIALYEKLGFTRVPFFCVKRKNTINETLFTGASADEGLNPYAKIIVNEARRRGINVEIIDTERGVFRLSYGGRSIRCRESLSDLTTGVTNSMCDDKTLTRAIVTDAGVRAPAQISADAARDELETFLTKHGDVVVKPARGEQGRGISVGLCEMAEVEDAISAARDVSHTVLVEEMVHGVDLRIVVINYKVVAAAIRKPASVVGDGQRTVRELIKAQSRRRAAATGGESKIPLDRETERAIRAEGYEWDSVLEADMPLDVRRTANLHTGGTIHDVTDELHSKLAEAAIRAARALEIPVVGIDFIVESPQEPDYAFIEANERPGLANHEPQPTAERFIDLLFPLSAQTAIRRGLKERSGDALQHVETDD